MFYAKDIFGKVAVIHEDNIFSDCPVCGKLHQVSVETFFYCADENGDIESSVWCEECSRKAKEINGANPEII